MLSANQIALHPHLAAQQPVRVVALHSQQYFSKRTTRTLSEKMFHLIRLRFRQLPKVFQVFMISPA